MGRRKANATPGPAGTVERAGMRAAVTAVLVLATLGAADCRQDDGPAVEPPPMAADAATELAVADLRTPPLVGVVPMGACPPRWNPDLGEVPAQLIDGETRGFHVELAVDATKVTARRVELALRVSTASEGASFERARLYDRDTCDVFFERPWPIADFGEGATSIETGDKSLRVVVFSNEYGRIPLMIELLASSWKGAAMHFLIPIPDQLLVPKLDARLDSADGAGAEGVP
jgi:hypothetical protein